MPKNLNWKSTGVDTSNIGKKTDLASLKSDIDKLDIDNLEKVPSVLRSLENKVNKLDVDKLIPVPLDLSKLSGVVKICVVKKTFYDELVKKFNGIQTTDTILKADYEKKKISEQKITEHDHNNKYFIIQELIG